MKCQQDGCQKEAKTRGFCQTHYVSNLRSGKIDKTKRFKRDGEICSVPGCNSPRKALGYCNKHWTRFRKYGDTSVRLLDNDPNPLIGQVCQHCGVGVIAYKDFCKKCYRQTDGSKNTRHKARVKRRIGLRSVLVERYTLEEVFVKSGGICCICGLPIEREYKNNLLKPTVEHIVPIALNGDDTLENVNLAHYSCNATKAHRELTEEQVKMLREKISLLQNGG